MSFSLACFIYIEIIFLLFCSFCIFFLGFVKFQILRQKLSDPFPEIERTNKINIIKLATCFIATILYIFLKKSCRPVFYSPPLFNKAQNYAIFGLTWVCMCKRY